MNVGIFLKQFKRSVQEIVEDIKHGKANGYGSEELTKLLKLLPEPEEVKRLKMFQGDQSKLSEADLFMLLLVRVPSYCLHLEAMILKEEFEPQVKSLVPSIGVLMEATHELQNCNELHTILRLVLKAGNFMNAGGYAGNAAGFHIASLLKLADIKANKPGINLIHFVAMEAGKKDKNLLSFPDKLEHIGAAARLSEDGLIEDLNKLEERLDSLQTNLHEDPELEVQMTPFLQSAKKELTVIWEKIELFQNLKKSLAEYFCEDEKFKMEEYCIVLKSFCEKFQKAVQENASREIAELRRQQRDKKNAEKRHSIAICSSIKNEFGQDELEKALTRNLRYQSLRRWECKSFKQDTFSDAHCTKKPYTSAEVTQVERERDANNIIKDFSDYELANLMRKVSVKVLNHQLGHCIMQSVNPVPKESIKILKQEPEMIKETVNSVQAPLLSKDYPKLSCRTMCSTPTKGLKSNEKFLTKSNPSHCSKWKRESLHQNGEQYAATKGKISKQLSSTTKNTSGGVHTSVHQRNNFAMISQQKDTELKKDNRKSSNRKCKVNNCDPTKIYPSLTQGQRAIPLRHKGQVPEKFSSKPTLQSSIQRQPVISYVKEKQEPHQIPEKVTARNGRKSNQEQKEKCTSSLSTSSLTSSRSTPNQLKTATSGTRNPHDKQSMLLRKPNSEKVIVVKHQTNFFTHKGAVQQTGLLKTNKLPVWR
ncbi:protein diaphanous homolog 3-like isoform X2 [Narcine bancroftii]